MSSAPFNDATMRLAAVASSDGAIITQDLTGTITSWNRAAEHIFGQSATEAVGQSIRLIVPPELQGEQDEIRCAAQADSVTHAFGVWCFNRHTCSAFHDVDAGVSLTDAGRTGVVHSSLSSSLVGHLRLDIYNRKLKQRGRAAVSANVC
jgi:PAS domain S-box-containing protein